MPRRRPTKIEIFAFEHHRYRYMRLQVFDNTARDIVDSVLEGYNGTIFAYGQTGAGQSDPCRDVFRLEMALQLLQAVSPSAPLRLPRSRLFSTRPPHQTILLQAKLIPWKGMGAKGYQAASFQQAVRHCFLQFLNRLPNSFWYGCPIWSCTTRRFVIFFQRRPHQVHTQSGKGRLT